MIVSQKSVLYFE